MQTQPKQTYFISACDAEAYYIGEQAGRRDGARRWGKQDTSLMSESEAMGYRDGYASTSHL
jgi:hypothetical protein